MSNPLDDALESLEGKQRAAQQRAERLNRVPNEISPARYGLNRLPVARSFVTVPESHLSVTRDFVQRLDWKQGQEAWVLPGTRKPYLVRTQDYWPLPADQAHRKEWQRKVAAGRRNLDHDGERVRVIDLTDGPPRDPDWQWYPWVDVTLLNDGLRATRGTFGRIKFGTIEQFAVACARRLMRGSG